MKPLTITLILLGFVFCTDGQTNSPSASNPMYLNHIYYSKADSLNSLEQTDGRIESKTKGLGYGGSESDLVVHGEKSPVRIKAGDTVRFVFKTAMTMMDPSMMVHLYKFTPKKGDREAVLSSQAGAYSKAKTTDNPSEIPFNVLKGTDDFIMIPASRLAPGEYGFINMMMVNGAGSRSMSYTLFAFGVD